MKYSTELTLAQSAARMAGKLIGAVPRGEKTVLSQDGKDIKLQTDQDAEQSILTALQGSAHPILTEESGEHGELGDEPFWVVDPLDGTLNFSRDIPMACVAIALIQNERPLLGVIYDFNRDEMFYGHVGEGAWLNEEPIHVSNRLEPKDSILATGFPSHRSYETDKLQGFVQNIQRFKKVRLFGSAALSLAYVACGRVDAYFEDDIMLWDVAAGLALVEAAGGTCNLEPSKRLKWGRRVQCACAESMWA